MDAATAVSGSGPGYLFYIFDQMVKVGIELGFSKEESTALVKQTAFGAGLLWREGSEEISELRERVASEGGTTEAAFMKFDELEVLAGIRAGMMAAFERSRHFGKG